MSRRLVLPLAAVTAALAFAGCGGSGDSSSSTDPASIAPADSPVFIEAAIRPGGSLKTSIDSLAKNVAGIDSVGGKIVAELEKSASADGEPFDYAKEVEPWLGEEAGLFLGRYDGDDFSGYGVLLPTSDTGATQDFIDKQAKESDEPVEDGSYEGVDYKIESDDGTTIGLIGDFLVIAQDERTFKSAVDASNGEALADVDRFSEAVSAAPGGSLADVYVDIGLLIKQSGDSVDPQALSFLETAGIDPTEATATASLIPSSDRVELDISSNLGKEEPSGGDASELLDSLPSDSFVAFAAADFGKLLQEAIDNIDRSGVPGEVPPNQLKSTLKEAGIDLDTITASLGDLGVFAEGTSQSSLGGAVVLTTKDASEATNTVSNIGLLLRAADTPGVTAVSGKATGFSIRSAELGSKPLVVIAKGSRIAIGYGLSAALGGLSEGSQTLADNPDYKDAVSALGGTPISGFVDGPAALRLAESLVPATETGFQEAKPYLSKVGFVAIGAGAGEGLSTAKLIVGFKK